MTNRTITVDLKSKFPHEIAEEDSELMQVWGEINNAWDQIERLLYVAFDAMLSQETSFATQAVFYSQRSHAARREMVESLAKYALLNRPQTAKKLKTAIKRVKARSNDRHALTHGMWAIGHDFATNVNGATRIALSSSMIPDRNDSYPKARLIEVRNSMRDTVAALREAIEPIDAAKRSQALELSARHVAMGTLLEPADA